MNNTISNQEKEIICMETRKENLNMNRHMDLEIGNHPAPLHGAPHHYCPLMREMDIYCPLTFVVV